MAFISFDEVSLQHGGTGAVESEKVELPAPRSESVVEETVVKQDQTDYKDSTELEPEIVTTGSSSSDNTSQSVVVKEQSVSKKKSVTKVRKSKSPRIRSETVFVRDFPREIALFARNEFPSATNNADALAAYVYVKSGKACDAPDSIKELAENWEGDKSLENMDARLHNLERQMSTLIAVLQELELGLSYITFDRLGYRRTDAKDVRSVDFLESGVTDLMARLREQTKQHRQQENIKNGRPIR